MVIRVDDLVLDLRQVIDDVVRRGGQRPVPIDFRMDASVHLERVDNGDIIVGSQIVQGRIQ